MESTSDGGGRVDRRYGLGRIVIADGAAGWGDTVAACLANEGFETATCTTAQAAQRLLSGLHPDLIVMAVALGDDTAGPLCRWIRLRSFAPVIVIAQREEGDAVALLEDGADLVLTAPVTDRELAARVRALLRRSPARIHGDAVLGFGGLKLDRAMHVLHLEAGTLHLSGREFLLMEALMLRGAGVTPRRVLEVTLGVRASELDGHVRRLRERIEPIEGWRRIVRERGVGLRLLEEPPATG